MSRTVEDVQSFSGGRMLLDPGGKVHCNSRDVVIVMYFDLSDVQAGADCHAHPAKRVAHFNAASYAPERSVKDCKQAIACTLDQPAAMLTDQVARHPIMTFKHGTPLRVAQSRRLTGRSRQYR